MTEKKAKITDENRSESAALLALWKVKHTLSQNDFGEAYGLGNQSNVGHYLHARNPLNLKAAMAFASHLECDISEFSPRLARDLKSLSQGEITHSVDATPTSSVRAYSDTNDRQAPVLEWACLGVDLYKNVSEVKALRYEPVPKRASSLVKWFIVEQDHRRFGISKGDMVALDPMQPDDEPEEMKRHVFQTASGQFVLAEYRTLAGNSFEALPDSGAPLEKDRHGLIVVARVRGVWEA